jgi:hypothetical protein
MTPELRRSLVRAVAAPEEYREQRPAMEGFRLVSASVTVTLLDDPQRARYAYDCHLETTGDLPARYWCYHLPTSEPEVSDVRAWDARGRLHPHVYAGEGPGARLEVRLRQAVTRGERYSFGFGYESSIHPVIAVDGRTRVVTYSDWVIFNIPCALLHVYVELPAGAEPLTAVPACAEDEGARITYRIRALRPLETVSFVVAYRRALRARPSYLQAMRAVGSGLLGINGQ